jgi:hypothetical protein
MSYSVKMEDIFPDDDEEEDIIQEYDEITDWIRLLRDNINIWNANVIK